MKQLFVRRGQVIIEEVPSPLIGKGCILVEVMYSSVSSGTELAGVVESKKSQLKKAIEQPEKVKKLLDHFIEHGVKRTVEAIKNKQNNTVLMGYSCSGIVIGVGEGVNDFHVGDKVACAGAGKANHAEIVIVPRNLAVKIPEGCDLKSACSVAIGSIAMQGIRRADPHFGEKVAVIGLGLLGQLTVQLLNVAGIRIIGIDINRDRVELSRKLGTEYGFISGEDDYLNNISEITNKYGVDATIITAAAKSNEIVQHAMEITRKKGRVVIVGDVGLELKRSPFYEKEIDLLISCSYGPGRYDKLYEERGLDYPFAYIRWTEKRNMEEYLRLISKNKIDLVSIINREYHISNAAKAYEDLKTSDKKPIGIVINYGKQDQHEISKKRTMIKINSRKKTDNKINVALVGAGSFAKGMHLPNIKALPHLYHLRAVVSASGHNAKETAEKFDADYCTTDIEDVLSDEAVDMVLIATRHNLHCHQAIASAKAGKAILMEKPMAINETEMQQLIAAIREKNVPFMVGFNRRFSPAAVKAKEIIRLRKKPVMMIYRVNAGYVPADNWVHSEEGGGRIIGEACHMIDFFNFIVDSYDVVEMNSQTINIDGEICHSPDNASITMRYRDCSICSLEYTSLGSTEVPKEYIEIYSGGTTVIINDYKEISIYGNKEKGWKSNKQDKGHLNELEVFSKYYKAQIEAPIKLDEMIMVSQITFQAVSNK